jgi:transcriptional antiterminator RfaH
MLTNLNISDLAITDNFNNKDWRVIHTKSRREKKVALHCNTTDIKYYLPLEQKIKLYGRKKIQTSMPLFPGYLFCFADEKERYQLLLTHQIAKILKVSNQLGLLKDLEKIFIAECANFSLIPCELKIEGSIERDGRDCFLYKRERAYYP